ncbi:TIM barrel protein [Actinomyces urogenitalis]|uniref:TIM barrel protein n=1 Tax=Actinomyces urogenitalis TaxID=103621 RepID=UPI00189B827E|nr:TIM barrel protein [Actinomyces urogenitalis]
MSLVYQPYIANLSTMYGSLARDQRAQAAADDGFQEVESWWDFDNSSPARSEIDSFIRSLRSAEVSLYAINSHGGNRSAGERGIAMLRDRETEFRESISSILAVAEETGATCFNVTPGLLTDAESRDTQLNRLADRYAWAIEKLDPISGTILIEPLSGLRDGYPFLSAVEVLDFINKFFPTEERVAILFDTYHLAANNTDIFDQWRSCHSRVGHVQFADFPGRGNLGTGSLDFLTFSSLMHDSGYSGKVSLEYIR